MKYIVYSAIAKQAARSGLVLYCSIFFGLVIPEAANFFVSFYEWCLTPRCTTFSRCSLFHSLHHHIVVNRAVFRRGRFPTEITIVCYLEDYMMFLLYSTVLVTLATPSLAQIGGIDITKLPQCAVSNDLYSHLTNC